jgi:Family of unknown function (DUF6491)
MKRTAVAAPAIAALAGALLAACAAGMPPHLSDQQLRERYQAYAGPPISQFTWFGHFYSWEGLGKDQLVVFTTPSDAYLLKVWPTCDLRFDFNLVGISSTASTVTSHGDYVTVHSAATGPMRCPIDEIRKVDYKRMQADLRAQSQAKAQAQAGQR